MNAPSPDRARLLAADQLWYKDAIIYQLHVKSFFDSNNDGIRDVHPEYGKMADVKHFIAAAHKRGLRVITELVINHTSDQHPWFQRARKAKPGSAWRDFYVWSDTDQKFLDTRIIFIDTEKSNWSWDPVAQAYYW